MHKDWRGSPIEEGCIIIHATCERGGAYITESEVIRIIPQQWMEDRGLPFPFYLYVKPIRRSDDSMRWESRSKREMKLQKTDKVTVIRPSSLSANIVDWRNDAG
jgi:hypothetical protein